MVWSLRKGFGKLTELAYWLLIFLSFRTPKARGEHVVNYKCQATQLSNYAFFRKGSK